MKFSTTLVATFASLSVAAPAHKRQVDDTTTSASTDAITDALNDTISDTITDAITGITGEEPVEDTSSSSTTISSDVSDALAAADPFDIYRVPAVPPIFPLEQNDFTGIQGVQSIQDDDDMVDAAISNLSSGTTSDAPIIPLTTGTPTVDADDDDADAFSAALDLADENDDLDVDMTPIPLSTGTATTTSLDGDSMDGVLTVDDVVVDDEQAQEMIDAAIRYAQQLPDVPVPLSTDTPTIFIDPYLGDLNSTTGIFGNSSTSTSALDSEDMDGTAATAATTNGADLVASLQALNDALASYQDLMDASATGTTTDADANADATATTDSSVDVDATKRRIKMLGDDMLSGIQQMQKRAEMAEQENRKMKKTMKKVLRQRGGMAGMFANKTESAATSKTVMEKMGKGVLERYVNVVRGN